MTYLDLLGGRDDQPALCWMTVFERRHMPSLGGATGWLNSERLGPAGLRGRTLEITFLERGPEAYVFTFG